MPSQQWQEKPTFRFIGGRIGGPVVLFLVILGVPCDSPHRMSRWACRLARHFSESRLVHCHLPCRFAENLAYCCWICSFQVIVYWTSSRQLEFRVQATMYFMVNKGLTGRTWNACVCRAYWTWTWAAARSRAFIGGGEVSFPFWLCRKGASQCNDEALPKY